MSDPFELVKGLKPTVEVPLPETIAIQRSVLLEATRSESQNDRSRPSNPRPERIRRLPPRGWVARGGLVLVGLGIVGSGVAAATAVIAPSPKNAATIESHVTPIERAGLRPGYRPELGAEEVLCDYRYAAVRTPFGQATISHEPLTQSLALGQIVTGCTSGNDNVRADPVPATTPAVLCVTKAPAQASNEGQVGAPVVVFNNTSAGAGYPQVPNEVDQINQRRQMEAEIDAVPQVCPSLGQAESWVHHELHALGLSLPIVVGPGSDHGTCHLAIVDWFAPHSLTGRGGNFRVIAPGPGVGYVQIN